MAVAVTGTGIEKVNVKQTNFTYNIKKKKEKERIPLPRDDRQSNHF
jgi:hypothetical protein